MIAQKERFIAVLVDRDKRQYDRSEIGPGQLGELNAKAQHETNGRLQWVVGVEFGALAEGDRFHGMLEAGGTVGKFVKIRDVASGTVCFDGRQIALHNRPFYQNDIVVKA